MAGKLSHTRYVFVNGHRLVGDVSATYSGGVLAIGGQPVRLRPNESAAWRQATGPAGDLGRVHNKALEQHAPNVTLLGDEFYVGGVPPGPEAKTAGAHGARATAADSLAAAKAQIAKLDERLHAKGPLVLLLGTSGSMSLSGDAALDAIDQIAETGAIARSTPARPGASARTPLAQFLREIESVQREK
jgi:hypothetical protein